MYLVNYRLLNIDMFVKLMETWPLKLVGAVFLQVLELQTLDEDYDNNTNEDDGDIVAATEYNR